MGTIFPGAETKVQVPTDLSARTFVADLSVTLPLTFLLPAGPPSWLSRITKAHFSTAFEFLSLHFPLQPKLTVGNSEHSQHIWNEKCN